MSFIDSICQKLVCPPKLNYSNFDLGPAITSHSRRTDFNVINANGLRINASFYENKKTKNTSTCVIYLHSMNGSRLESLVYVQQILRMGYTFCNFDFTGCGNSQGKSISFGANQKHDVFAVIQLLKLRFNINKVFLWGRSMGSACAIKYCQMMSLQAQQNQQIEILGIILDSCYASFSQLVVQIGHKKAQMPQFLIKAGYYIIKSNLENLGKFKTNDLELQQLIGSLKVPAFFLTSNDDLVVNCEHSKTLFDLYNHKMKRLVYFKGNHNQARDNIYVDSVIFFMRQAEEYYNQHRKMEYYEQINRLHRLESKEIYFQRRKEGYQAQKPEQKWAFCECSLLPNSSNKVYHYEASNIVKRNSSENLKQKTRLSFKQERSNVKKHYTQIFRDGQKVRLSKMTNYLQAAKSQRFHQPPPTQHSHYDFL